MKLAKSLLLDSAAALVATAPTAADLPSGRFFPIPGTDACLKVGGRVRADYGMSGKKNGYTASVSTLAASKDSEILT